LIKIETGTVSASKQSIYLLECSAAAKALALGPPAAVGLRMPSQEGKPAFIGNVRLPNLVLL
jgi:hypothetical protein